MTAPLRPFRFGVQAYGPADPVGWAEQARRAEDLGYSTLTVADHLDNQLAPIPALVAAADATSTLRIGTLVLANDYRHPVVCAREAATVDLLSAGRLELGLGAGWMTSDYEHAGFSLHSPATRVDRLAEAVAVIKPLLEGKQVTYRGDQYRIRGLDGRPLPVQRPRPPLLIGGGGRRVLSLAAREADIVGLNPDLRAGVIDTRAGPDATVDATDRKIGWIREAAGDSFSDIELHVRIHIASVSEHRDEVADAVAPGFGISAAEALASPHALVGTESQIIEQLLQRRERWGLSYVGLSADVLDEMGPVVARLAGT